MHEVGSEKCAYIHPLAKQEVNFIFGAMIKCILTICYELLI